MAAANATALDREPTAWEPDACVASAKSVLAAHYELVVMGGDLAAFWAAEEAVRLGKKVALVAPAATEPTTQERLWATDYALREAGRVARRLAGGGAVGPAAASPGQVDFHAVLQWAGQIAARLATCPSLQQLAQSGVDFFPGQAVFVRPNAVSVEGHALQFRRAILAGNLRVGPVNIAGLAESECLTAESIPLLPDLPHRLAVAGAGPRACLWAQTFCRLGSEVYLIDPSPTVLPGEDPDVVRLIQGQLEADGVHLDFGCQSLEVQRTGNQRVLVIEREDHKEKLFVDQILVDTPTRPDLAGFGLEAAGVSYAEQGVAVDERLQTSNRRIFALGAACGPQCAGPEVAQAVARLAVHNALAFWPWARRRVAVPRWIGTCPEVAALGLTPSEAAAAGLVIDVYQADLGQTDRAVLEGRQQGFVKVYVDHFSGRLVGACVAGDEAGELLGPLSILLARRLPLSAAATVIPCRPMRFAVLQRLAASHLAAPRPSWCARIAGRMPEAWKHRLSRIGGSRT